LNRDLSFDDLILLDFQLLLQVEHGLLPVGGSHLGSSSENDLGWRRGNKEMVENMLKFGKRNGG
jgi:hypothetical protein